MAAKMFLSMLDPAAPAKIIGFLCACMLTNPKRRPHNAGDLHEEFDALLAKHAGPPKYRPFVMPAEVTH
jgi:hypothetical protein